MGPEFAFPPRTQRDIWAPLIFADGQRESRGNHWLLAFGRLREGVSLEQADAAMNVIADRLAEAYPDSQEGRGAVVQSLPELAASFLKPALLVLWGAVTLVLLVACGNVANLLLARFSARRREMALRNALGAGRQRLVRQALAESLLLGVFGAAAGIAVCLWAVPALTTVPGARIPPGDYSAVSLPVLGFCLAASLLAAVIAGVGPAIRASAADPQSELKAGGGSAGRDPARDPLRRTLVVAEIALACTVVVGAGLLLKSFDRLSRVDLGIDAENVVTMRIPLSGDAYNDSGNVTEFWARLLESVNLLPGVESAGLTQVLPVQSWGWNGNFDIRGRPASSVRDQPFAEARRISPGYFRTLGIGLLRGRKLSEQDIREERKVVLINEELARRYWPDADPLGEYVGGEGWDWFEVIGVVSSIHNAGPRRDKQAILYFPFPLSTDRLMSLAVRSSGDPTQLVEAISAAVREIDPEQPVYNIQTMQEVISRRVAPERFQTTLFVVFALLAGVLATAGVYGLVAYSVEQRTRELGLRMALGAVPREVQLLVLGQGLRLGLIGATLGVGLALALGRSLESLLFGVEPSDPSLLAAAATGVLAVASLAAYLPARRASRVEPMAALRNE